MEHAENHAGPVMFINATDDNASRHSRRPGWLGPFTAACLLLIAGGVHAGAIYKCVDAHGQVAFQANACPARTRQTAVDVREQPLIDPDAPVVAPMKQKSGTQRAHARPRPHRASRRARARKEPLSWECRAADGEVFYRHTHCPHSVPGDGVMRSGGTYALRRGGGSRSRARSAWDPVPVHARKVPRSEACRQINAVAAVERDGSARDERVSVYEHDLGRDPCAGF